MLPDTTSSKVDSVGRQAPSIASLRLDVLLSVGRHALTGRAQRADGDARALEMALSLAQRLASDEGSRQPAIELLPWHLGPEGQDTEAALRGYLGMGLDAIGWLRAPAAADALAPLREALSSDAETASGQARIVLSGMRAEQGEGSGMLPMALADGLGWAWVPGVVAVERLTRSDTGAGGYQAVVLQALPRGQRRRLAVSLPAILGVDGAAPAPRQSAFGPARRGRLEALESRCAIELDPVLEQWPLVPAKARPRRLKIVTAASARDRFKAAAAKADGGGGRVLENLSAEQGASAILSMLEAEGVVQTARARYDQQDGSEGDGR